MKSWRETVDIKDVLLKYEDESSSLDDDANVPNGLKADIARAIKLSKWLPVETLTDELDTVETLGDFNNWLDDLYNIADAKRVWLGR